MRRGLFLLVSLIAVASVFVTAACSSSEAGQNTGSKGISQEESQEIARQYVTSDPTFQFDGMMETLALVNTTTLKCPYCWEFVYQFDCRQAGYGNRTGLMVAQVITPHTARIVVEEGMITSAVMDSDWDMMAQKTIGNNTT
jgi:hypothetical protein